MDMTFIGNKRLLTVVELAAYLSVAPCTIRQWDKQGIIPSFSMGRVLRFDLDLVLKALEGHGKSERSSLKIRLRQKDQP